MKCIAPSILSADFSKLGTEVRAVDAAGADWIHVDVMDGHFVPNITVGPLVVRAVKRVTALPLDVHLMIENPDYFLEQFVEAGADGIIVHREGSRHLHRTVQRIRSLGKRVGVAINPATPPALLEAILPELDLVLVMTVNPGFGGQSFIPYVLDKLREARKIIDASGRPVRLEIDGGVKVDNIGEVAAAGADTFVAGSAIFGAAKDSDPNTYDSVINAMRAELAKVKH